MPFAIKNVSSSLVFIPLHSRTNLRLSPGEVAKGIPDVEVKDNAKIEKLLSQRVITVTEQAGNEDAKPADREEESVVVAAVEAEADDEGDKPRKAERRGSRQAP